MVNLWYNMGYKSVDFTKNSQIICLLTDPSIDDLQFTAIDKLQSSHYSYLKHAAMHAFNLAVCRQSGAR